MEIGSAEAARRLGVSERRVQDLARAQRLDARQVGRIWLIEDELLGRAHRRSRPMSERMGRALVVVLSDPSANAHVLGVAPSEVSRLRKRVHQLLGDPDPAGLLESWFAGEPVPLRFAADPVDLPFLARDRRVVLSGVSDGRSGMAVSDEVEAWIDADDLPSLEADYLLVGAGRLNVRLHLGDPGSPVPFGRLLVDLSRHAGARERHAVRSLLEEAAHRYPSRTGSW